MSYYILSGSNHPIEPRTMQRRFKSILKKAGLPSIHYHSLRHMFATNCIQMGFDVKTLSEILGHSSVETTLKLYVHSSIERKKECMNLLRIGCLKSKFTVRISVSCFELFPEFRGKSRACHKMPSFAIVYNSYYITLRLYFQSIISDSIFDKRN